MLAAPADGIAAGDEQAPRRRAPTAPRLALVAAIITTVIVGVCSVRGEPTHDHPTDDFIKPLPPPTADAFQAGGRPLGDPAIEALLVGEFTDLLIVTPRAHRDDERVRVRHDAVARAPAIAARGPAFTAAWADMLAVIRQVAAVPTGGAVGSLADELDASVSAVSDLFAAAGIGLHLTGYVRLRDGRPFVEVYTHRVEEVVFVEAAGDRWRTLSLRRIDRLRRSWAALGMQSDEHGDPVVLLDKVEKYTATVVLPTLAVDAPYPFGEWDGGGLPAAAGLALRRELTAALGDDARAAAEIGALIAERKQIVDGWRQRLADPQPGPIVGVYLPADTLATLADRVDAHQHGRVRDIEDRLRDLEAGRIAGQLNALVAATVRRHEAQHAIDAGRDEPLPSPALAPPQGAELDPAGPPRRPPGRAPAELSAYLSQIANDPHTPQLSLWHAARPAFDRSMGGTAEAYAGVVIVEGLGRHLGVSAAPPATQADTIDRSRLLAPALALANASSDQLRTAAHALWHELFAEPLLPMRDVPNAPR